MPGGDCLEKPGKDDMQDLLSSVYYLDKELATLVAVRDSLQEDLAFLRAVDYSKDRISSGASRGSVEDPAIKIADAEGEVTGKINELVQAKRFVARIIDKLPNGTQRAVMYNRYILLKTWKAIAVDLNYSYRHVLRLHRDALNQLREMCYDT